MKRFAGLWVLMSVLLAGCGGISPHLEDNTVSTGCFVFGYVDMGKAPCNLDWFEYKQVLPPVKDSVFDFRTYKGAFYREDFIPGSFELVDFGGRGKPFLIFPSNDYYTFKLPVQESGFRIHQTGRVYYVGSYKMTSKGDFFVQNYDVEEIQHPNELELLQVILPNAQGNPWEPLIQQRIAQLTAQGMTDSGWTPR